MLIMVHNGCFSELVDLIETSVFVFHDIERSRQQLTSLTLYSQRLIFQKNTVPKILNTCITKIVNSLISTQKMETIFCANEDILF